MVLLDNVSNTYRIWKQRSFTPYKTPLHRAVAEGHTFAAWCLLKAGANPLASDPTTLYDTPFHQAVRFGQV